jgi:uncharacterized protein (TIGR00645 family)
MNPSEETFKSTPVQRLLIFSSLLLVPLYFVLIAALVPYGYRAILELGHLYISFRGMEESELIISVLTLCDIVMIANLIIMIALGSYHVFIRQISMPKEEKPSWLVRISSGLLKIKMATSLIGISSIHLLKDFINANNTDWVVVAKHGILHVIFLCSAMALGYVEKVTHTETH